MCVCVSLCLYTYLQTLARFHSSLPSCSVFASKLLKCNDTSDNIVFIRLRAIMIFIYYEGLKERIPKEASEKYKVDGREM